MSRNHNKTTADFFTSDIYYTTGEVYNIIFFCMHIYVMIIFMNRFILEVIVTMLLVNVICSFIFLKSYITKREMTVFEGIPHICITHFADECELYLRNVEKVLLGMELF